MKTAITDLLEIDIPILAFSHCRDVVAAVSKAGGMGVLGAVAHSPRSLEIDLAWIEAEVGDKPYGVDLIVPAKYEGSDAGGVTTKQIAAAIPPEHRAYVDQILEKYDVPPMPEGERGATLATGENALFSANNAAPQLEIFPCPQPIVDRERARSADEGHDRQIEGSGSSNRCARRTPATRRASRQCRC